MKRLILLSLATVNTLLAIGQSADTRERYVYNLTKAAGDIVLDGELDEDCWASADVINNFYNHWPIDSGLAVFATKVRMTYDADFIYVSAECYDDGERIIQSLKRDNDGHWQSDGFTVAIDPINKRTNGFLFGVNAGGAQMEATMSAQGSNTRNDTNWDNKWYSQVREYEDRWVVEMAIPFKSLRYNSENTSWGINFIRNDMKNNVYTTWTRFPLNFGGNDLGYNGLLSWDNPPAISKGKVVLIPYTAGGVSKYHEDGESTEYDIDVGIDAKISLTSSLNLDLTVNPDFSNVDVDQQVTNLSRYSLFFPEKRNFFLENSDLFSNFGTWHTKPFFSRQIGIHDGEQIPILYGARISGNVTDDLRLGAMNIQTRETDDFNAQNYTVAAVQQKVLSRSNVKALFINRNSTSTIENEQTNDFNRLGGMEFQYVSKDGKLGGSAKYHQAVTSEQLSDNSFAMGEVYYDSKNFFTGFSYSQVGENFISDVGFVPRLDNYDPIRDTTVRAGYKFINPWVGGNFYPKAGSRVNQHGPRSWTLLMLNPDGSLNERITSLVYFLNFSNKSDIRFVVRNNEINLKYILDFIDEDNPLPVGNYKFTNYNVWYSSDPRTALSMNLGVSYGGFYNGNKFTLNTNINMRKQPWGNFGIAYTQNKVVLADGYGEANLHLIGPKAEISFSNNMFWTSFLQYNTQAENFNINSRFQWRYKPMSDLFVVYSENYATTNLGVKNRGLVFKLTYWLNM